MKGAIQIQLIELKKKKSNSKLQYTVTEFSKQRAISAKTKYKPATIMKW